MIGETERNGERLQMMQNQLVMIQTSRDSSHRDRCIVCRTEQDFRREGVRNRDAVHGEGLVQLVHLVCLVFLVYLVRRTK